MWHAWERTESDKILVGKPKGKKPLRRLTCRRVNGTEVDLKETNLGGMEWIHLAQDRDWWRALVNVVMNLQVLMPRSWLLVKNKTE
jgi:hypothetical protein